MIQSGKVVHDKPKNEKENEDNTDNNEIKSKTPNKINKKKYDEDDDNINNDKKKKKNDDDIKNYLSKSLGEENIEVDDDNEVNNGRNEGNMTDYEDDVLRGNRIKKYKNHMGNYFFMTKIRKGKIDESTIKPLENNNNNVIQDENKNNNINNINDHEDNMTDNKEYEIMPNIIKNICY